MKMGCPNGYPLYIAMISWHGMSAIAPQQRIVNLVYHTRPQPLQLLSFMLVAKKTGLPAENNNKIMRHMEIIMERHASVA